MKKKLNRLIILAFLFISCNSYVGTAIKIINDVCKTFEIRAAEIKYNLDDEEFTLIIKDLDFSEASIGVLESKAIKMDSYLTPKYELFSSKNEKINLFTSPIEIVEFKINSKGEVIDSKEY